jgi:gliding motility-associated-like protein
MKKLLPSILLLVFASQLKSGPGPLSKRFINEKDVFGTRAFIENKGQYDQKLSAEHHIRYVLDNGMERIYFTDKGLVYEFAKHYPLTERQREDIEKGKNPKLRDPDMYYVNMNWLNANPSIIIEKSERTGHYFTFGSKEYNSYGFKKITYKNVYPNIDIEYTIPKDKDIGIKYNVVLHPGADPANIKIAYTGDVSRIRANKDGDMVIKTSIDEITEHLPKSFYSDGGPIESNFTLVDGVIGFNFQNGYDQGKTVVIDPWVTTITSLTTSNYAYDVDFDFSANTYIYGGYNPFKVARYNNSGVLQWTFSGIVVSPAWTSAPILSQASNFGVNRFTSKTYIGQGYVNAGNVVIRLDALGNYDNFQNTANNQFEEVWDMGFHCANAELFVLGGGTSSNISAVTINPTTAAISLTTFQPTNTNIAQDVVCNTIDDAGNIFINYAGLGLNDKMCLVNSTFNGNLWTQPSTFTSFTEQGNKNQYPGAPSLSSNGFNCLAVNANYLFYYDGFNIAAYNKTTGALVASTTISGLTKKQQGGIAVDDCNNLYLGGNGNILGYNFTGSAFNAITNISLGITNQYQYVFDLKLDKQNKILYAAGSGFVGVYSPVNTISCATASSACFFSLQQDYIICAGQVATITAVNSTSLGAPSYSMQPGAVINSTGIFTVSPTVNTVYTVFISGTNQANIVVTNSAVSTVSVFAQPHVAPTFTQTTCTSTLNGFNLNLGFTPASPVPSYTVNWSTVPNGITLNSQTSVNSTTGNVAAGVYSSTITTDWGCLVTSTFTINPIPDPATFNISPPGGNYLISCNNPSVTLTFAPSTFSYFSSNGASAPINGSVAVFTSTNPGIWTTQSTNTLSGCFSSQTFTISTNFSAPTTTISPGQQNITCSVTSIITVTANASPTVNVTHLWMDPQGATLTAAADPAFFVPGGPGTYTHCARNDVSGCTTCKTFSITSNDGYPSFSVVSPQNFTLGCTTKSVATINIVGAVTTPTAGGPVSYTMMAPGITALPPGTLSALSTYTVNLPGTYTIITMDNTNSCRRTSQISILTNTFEPNISAVVPQQTLTCSQPTIILQGQSLTNNVGYNWSFPGSPGNVPGSTITINSNSLATTNSVIANYTLTITDNNNTCKSTSVIPMYQNLFRPIAAIGGGNVISCSTQTQNLSNASSSSIPPNIPHNAPVIAYLWEGPAPQEPLQVSTTYVAFMPGTYTMTAMDLNNGCVSTVTKTITDDKIYPSVTNKAVIPTFTIDCGLNSTTSLSLDIVPPTTGFSYTWIAPPTTTLNSPNNPVLVVNQTGRYELFILNPANGCMSSGVANVIDADLKADFILDQQEGYAPLTVSFTNTSASSNTATGTHSITSIWSFGNGMTASVVPTGSAAPGSTSTTYYQPGTYTVTMYATKGNCLDTAFKIIKVDIPSDLSIPNIFTPNNDGVNDIYFLKASKLDQIKFKVVDRWSHLVYEVTSETGNIEWDGKNQLGKDVPDGVYTYILEAIGKDGHEFKSKGNITLVR